MYVKHDSFIALKHKKNKKSSYIIDRIIKTSKDISIVEKLSLEGQKILSNATKDLLDNTNSSSKTKFNLKSNVIAEINTIADSDLPRYLVHRYRYEIYPQLTDHHFTGEYPVKIIDELGEDKVTQLSLLSTASNN